jgi:hypothetical protein
VTDYQSLIARAVEGLASHKGEARRALYERARTALVAQLRAVDPPLSESVIAKERFALESAIREVETDAARKVLLGREHHSAAASPQSIAYAGRAVPTRLDKAAQSRDKVAPHETTETPRERPPEERSHRSSTLPSRKAVRRSRNIAGGADDFGGATVQPAQSPHNIDESHGSTEHYSAEADLESDADDFSAIHHDAQHSRRYRESSYDGEESDSIPEVVPLQPRESEDVKPHSTHNHRKLGYVLLALIVSAGLSATISWQWPHITGLYRDVTQTLTKQSARPNEAASPPKFSGRAPQEQRDGKAPAEAAPGNQTAPAEAQRAILYEEDSNDPQGKRYVASVVWRTEAGLGLAPELAVHADLEVPERHIKITWALRRNTNQAVPASHTMEIKFDLPGDFPGSVANVPGMLMKESEQARGTALAAAGVKVTNNFFLIGLSATDADRQRNIQLLKENSWIDIPIIYMDGRRSILAAEKGSSGDRAFADAFAAWEME